LTVDRLTDIGGPRDYVSASCWQLLATPSSRDDRDEENLRIDLHSHIDGVLLNQIQT
jgi:hypothetical protein